MEGESMFRTVGNKGRLFDRVVSEIQSLIVSGRLEAGVKLPPERELAEELGVSRTVVREAVRILVAKGLLETKPGVGTIVRQVTTDQVVEPLSLLLRTQGGPIPIEHLDQVRHILEVEIAGLAAMQATEEDVAELKRVMVGLEAIRDDSEAFAAGDADFHRALAQTTHNPLLMILLDSIRDLMQEVRALVARYPDLADRVMPDHYKVLERVIAEDVEGARQAMAEHLEHARRIQEQVLKESKNTPHSSSTSHPASTSEKIGPVTEGRYA
jgi:GntR family transcriptional repressor for pyruvate dehydrogenase complex